MKIRGVLNPDSKDFYELDVLDYLRDYHRVQETILDIGAGIGNHAVYFANFLTYDILACFEPIPEKYGALIKNLTGSKSIQLYQYAVADKRGQQVKGGVQVQGTTIDMSYFSNVSFMRINVGKFGPHVLEGAKDTIFRCHPLILIEDLKNTYAKLLPEYELEKAWPEYNLYLYRWK